MLEKEESQNPAERSTLIKVCGSSVHQTSLICEMIARPEETLNINRNLKRIYQMEDLFYTDNLSALILN